MSNQKDFVLKGSPLEGNIPNCSLGEYLLSKARSHPQDRPIHVDAETGAVQTLGELLAMSIRLSEGLKLLGVKENDVVGMMVRNSFEADEIVLGTWLSGAVISPVPGSMTIGEFKHILGITKPKVIFCEEEALSNISEALNHLSLPSRIILVGDTKNFIYMNFREVLAKVDVEKYKTQPVKSPSSQLIAILPSSGTSGLQKGVGITHTNLIFQDLNMEYAPHVSPLCTKRQTLGISKLVFLYSATGMSNETNCILQISQFFWVTGIILFLRSLTLGSKRVLLRNPTHLNCLKAIHQYKTDISLAAPLFVLAMATHPDFEKYDLSSMKVFLVGGSPFTPSIDEKVKEKWPEVKLVQVYGTTEVSGTVCYNKEGDPYSLGTVTAGVQVKVVDRTTGECLKSNALGEILIKSPGLMLCYVGDEDAYNEAVDAEGWFHSGDLGYYNDSGQVFLVDRLKEMVKVMNYQVSPTEVENVILSVPGVVEAGVSGVTRDGTKFELLAVVVKDKESTVTKEDIHVHIANSLSEYKSLTGGIYFSENLPKTPSGKINRNKMKSLAQSLYSGE